MRTSEASYLETYKRLVEGQYPIGRHTGKLTQRDFEYLAEQIEEKCGISLSLSTLKRIWRKDYQSVPHLSTLNALVTLLNYESWQEFIQDQETETPSKESFTPVGSNTSFSSSWGLIGMGILGVFLIVLFLGNRRSPSKQILINSPVFFSGNKTVDKGLPNTVIFEYDLSGVQADSFFFQQAWDETYREPVNPMGRYHNSIYYYPGFHKAKLIANDSILKIHRVHLLTNGWLPYLNNATYTQIPRYLQAPNTHSGSFSISPEDLDPDEIQLSKGFKLTYANMQDFKGLSSTQFYLDTRLRMDSVFYNPCPELQIYIHAEVHVFKVALTSKGCVSDIWLKMGENYLLGEEEDLSAMGTDLFSYQQVELQAEGNQARVFLNGQQVLDTHFEQDLGEIKGIDFRFTGIGEVDYVRLGSEKNRWIFQEEFNGE